MSLTEIVTTASATEDMKGPLNNTWLMLRRQYCSFINIWRKKVPNDAWKFNLRHVFISFTKNTAFYNITTHSQWILVWNIWGKHMARQSLSKPSQSSDNPRNFCHSGDGIKKKTASEIHVALRISSTSPDMPSDDALDMPQTCPGWCLSRDRR